MGEPGKKLIKGLAEISCQYNFKETIDGKCYSSKCMMNQNYEIRKKIKNEGCVMFKKLGARELNCNKPID